MKAENNSRMIERKDLVRFAVFGGLISVIVVIILVKYFSLMVLTPPPDTRSESPLVVERGPILDRNGRILAVETRQYSVTAWIPSLENKDEDAQLLSGILDIGKEEVLKNFDTHTGFIYVMRKITQAQTQAIQTLKDEGKLVGISLEPDYARIYPEGDLAAHAIGYVGTDNVGLDGVEYSFNNQLSPPPPATGASGEAFGDQVFLTIDRNVQYFAQELAGKVYNDAKAEAVILLVEQAKTGDILAYVSFPEFDPNTFAKYPVSARRDLPVTYIYEPGSVLKIFTISSFLQLGGITPEWRVYDDGFYVRRLPDGTVIRIAGLAPHEWEDAQLIIKWSSNVGAAYASDNVSDAAFYQMLRAFGFGGPTFITLPGEENGILRPIDQWSARSKPTISFGQEIGVTAMQIAAAATALTNGGVLLKPHIVSRVVSPDGKVIQSFPREPIRQVISPTVATEMLQYMETGTEPGAWAAPAKIPGVPTSAKTGTSQMYDPRTGTYSESAYVGSSIAIFPTNDPQYIVYAVVVDPKNKRYWGSYIASPLVREVSERLVSYYGVPKENDEVVEAPKTVSAPASKPLAIGPTLPDLTGLSKRDILPLFQDSNIRVKVIGEGWVVRQDPAPGTPITKGMTVTVQLH